MNSPPLPPSSNNASHANTSDPNTSHPNTSHPNTSLSSRIESYLIIGLHGPAVHLATLLHALSPSPASSLLLSRSHQLNNAPSLSLSSLAPYASHPTCIYQYLNTLLSLKQYTAARTHWRRHSAKIPPSHLPAAHHLMGLISDLLHLPSAAAHHYKSAFSLDPYLTQALAKLCERGVTVDIMKAYDMHVDTLPDKMAAIVQQYKAQQESRQQPQVNTSGNDAHHDFEEDEVKMSLRDLSIPTPPSNHEVYNPPSFSSGMNGRNGRNGMNASTSGIAQPNFGTSSNFGASGNFAATPTTHMASPNFSPGNSAGVPTSRILYNSLTSNTSNFMSTSILSQGSNRSALPATSLFATPDNVTPIKHERKKGAVEKLRFESFESEGGLLGHTGGGCVEKDMSAIEQDIAVSAVKQSPGRKRSMSKEKADEGTPARESSLGNEVLEIEVAGEKVREVLTVEFLALQMHHTANSHLAIQTFGVLPPKYVATSYIQRLIGCCYFTLADYSSSRIHFASGYELAPESLDYLSLYSTTLWHLKQEVELSYLAQKVVEVDVNSPETWCVVGNAFSLQKEHEVALKFFHRASQCDSRFAYAHTLSGHEYVSNEDFERAVGCFRAAIREDKRHTNAWYGLGAIYYRQEKFKLAEYHFRQAISLNPQSSILYCHLGMVLHASKKELAALNCLDMAFSLDPANPQARFQRASVLISLDRYEEALDELISVRDHAPREAAVHFLIGKVYKRLGDTEQAMRSFVTALDLDPKDNNLIKAAIDRLDEQDVEEDVSGF